MVSFSGIVKSGIISGAFVAAGYAAAAHPVTLVALGALPWIADAARRCCSNRREPAIRVPVRPAAPAAAVVRAQAAPVAQRAEHDDHKGLELALARSQEDQELRAALEQSRQDHEFLQKLRADLDGEEAAVRAEFGLDGKEFDLGDPMAMAIAASRDPSENVYICTYAHSLFGGGDQIDENAIVPLSLLFEKSNGTKCNFASYMLSLLSMPQLPNEAGARDILGLAINQRELEQMADQLGISCNEYLNIWVISGLLHGSPDTRREGRFALFKQMVEKGGNREAIQYYQNHHPDVWK